MDDTGALRATRGGQNVAVSTGPKGRGKNNRPQGIEVISFKGDPACESASRRCNAFVDCLAFAPDESRLIAGVRGSLLQLLEATSLNLICDRYLRGHLGMSTLSINYIACGDRMVVSIQPKHVYVLDGR